MQYSANTNSDDQEKKGMFSDPGPDSFCFICGRFAEQSLQIRFPLYPPLPPSKKHSPSSLCPVWPLAHT